MEPDESSLPAGLAGDGDLARAIAGAPPGEARDAEAELCRRLAPRIRLYGLRHLRDGQAAADLAQQVLLMTLESLRSGRLREPEKLVSFVLGTCRLVVRGWRRGAERRRRLLEQFAREQPQVQPFSVPEADADHLAACLQRLAERERSVLIMTFYAERTSDDVARQLGLSPENVRVIRHRALGRVLECLTGGRRDS